MQIPVFEIKDSYIVKHKLEYNTSYDFGSYTDNGFTSYKQRMIFVDNDIARKSQSLNAENFESITINNNLQNIEKIEISYFGDTHTIYFDGVLEYENQWIKDTNVFNYTRPIQSQEFKTVVVNDISTDDTVSVEIYKKTTETGNVDWEYTSTTPNEKWSISGLTSTGNQWVVNGNNTVIGYETGSTTWSYDKITPYLKYESNVLSVTNYTVTLEKKIDDYIFNNFSSDSDIYYKIITNNHCAPNYSYLYDKLKYYKYFDMIFANLIY